MTHKKIQTLQQRGKTWTNTKQLFSLTFQKHDIKLEELDSIFEIDSDTSNLKPLDKSNSDVDIIMYDQEDYITPSISQVLFKELFKLYEQLIVEDYLSDIHTVNN